MKLKSFGVSVYPDIESLEDITKYLPVFRVSHHGFLELSI